jgi:hypothetical protein
MDPDYYLQINFMDLDPILDPVPYPDIPFFTHKSLTLIKMASERY